MIMYVLAVRFCLFSMLQDQRIAKWERIQQFLSENPPKPTGIILPPKKTNRTPRVVEVTLEQFGVNWPEGMVRPVYVCYLTTFHIFTPLMEPQEKLKRLERYIAIYAYEHPEKLQFVV